MVAPSARRRGRPARQGRIRRGVGFWTALLLAAAFGCGPQVKPKLSSIQQRIFTPSCALSSCHGSPSPPRGLSLAEGKAYGSLVGVESSQAGTLRVKPGSPDESFLIHALEGDADKTRMMPVGSQLEPEELDAVRQWISRGAPDD